MYSGRGDARGDVWAELDGEGDLDDVGLRELLFREDEEGLGRTTTS